MEQHSTETDFSAPTSEVSPDANMPGSQTIATATSAKENLPAPRDLNHSFQRPATQQIAFFEINDAQQRIAQLERAVHSLTHEKTVKDNNIQALQATVERLQADMFDDIGGAEMQVDPDDHLDDIDGAGMQAEPDDHLHSNWRAATSPLFSSPTPVKPSQFSYPNAPRLQQQFPSVIDHASEIAMLKKQIQDLQLRTPTHQPGLSPQPTSNDVTAAFLPVIKAFTDEVRLLRNTDNVPLKSYKNITDDVPLNYVLQDWERWFYKNKRQPSVAAVIEKIQHGGNLWAWYQSQCTYQDSRGLIPAHDIIDNWTWERFKKELRASHLHKESDRAAIRKDFEDFKCTPFPSIADLESYISTFENKAQKLRVHNMIGDYPDARLANKFYDGLPPHIHRMAINVK